MKKICLRSFGIEKRKSYQNGKGWGAVVWQASKILCVVCFGDGGYGQMPIVLFNTKSIFFGHSGLWE
ncbi:MAG: hypothetical protein J6B00_01880 [Alphaproteobacteria bacterium]|nr:hypothetical protein [Alphaproteobacteria bacterium]